jgi:hypothetical protein
MQMVCLSNILSNNNPPSKARLALPRREYVQQ